MPKPTKKVSRDFQEFYHPYKIFGALRAPGFVVETVLEPPRMIRIEQL